MIPDSHTPADSLFYIFWSHDFSLCPNSIYALTFSLLFQHIFPATGVFSYIQSLPSFSDGNLPLLFPKGSDGIPHSVVQIINFFSCLQDESLPHQYTYTFQSQADKIMRAD